LAPLVVAALLSVGSAAAAGTRQETMSQVRSSSSSILVLIARAREQSTTFRRLLDTVGTTDGIVYVEAGRCRYSRACLTGVSAAGAYRMLWVTVDTRRVDLDLIASIGHELQHAIEILSNPDVRDTAAMYIFYSRFARRVGTGRGAWETAAATAAGNAVREEIERSSRVVDSPSMCSWSHYKFNFRSASIRQGVR
jgi:hypothetical protein